MQLSVKEKVISLLAILFSVVIGIYAMRPKGNPTPPDTKKESKEVPRLTELPDALLGVYSGTQGAYGLKNEYGDYIKVNGQTITVPACYYRFTFASLKRVGVRQINLIDDSQYYAQGDYSIVSVEDNKVRIRCEVTNDVGRHQLSPTYHVEIALSGKTGLCANPNEPLFELKRTE